MPKYKRALIEDPESVEAPGENAAIAVPSDPLAVTVVFTTVAATLDALREASGLAHQLKARIRILVPSVVPYPLDIAHPRVDPLFRLRHFRTLCEQHSIETFVDVRLCRDRLACIRDALAPHSLVVIGARKEFWPFRAERILVSQLRIDGHEVTLINSHNRGRSVSWFRSLWPEKRRFPA